MIFLLSLASITLIASVIILLMLTVSPFLDKKFAAGGRYFLWLVMMGVLLIAPFAIFVPRPTMEISVPILTEQPTTPQARYMLYFPSVFENPIWVPPAEILALPDEKTSIDRPQMPMDGMIVAPADVPAVEPRVPLRLDLTTIVMVVWIFGIVVSLVLHGLKHVHFTRFVRRWSTPWYYEGFSHKKVRLMRCKGITSPMLIGFARPKILLPYKEYNEAELSFILCHEMTHYRRKDL